MTEEEYQRLVDQAKSLVVKKHADYQQSVELKDYFPFGHKSYVQMLHVKTLRLRSLAAQSAPPANESVKDSVLDLINYAVFYLAWLEANK